MWDKILAVGVVVLLVVLAFASTITSEAQSDVATMSEVTFEIITADEHEEKIAELTMEIPGEITLLNKMESVMGMGSLSTQETTSVDTEIEKTTPVVVHCSLDISWDATGIDQINEISMNQSAVDQNGFSLIASDLPYIDAPYSDELQQSKSVNLGPDEDPYTITPSYYFDSLYNDEDNRLDDLLIENLDESVWTNDAEVSATANDGSQIQTNSTLETKLNVNYDEVDNNLELSMTVNSMGAEQ